MSTSIGMENEFGQSVSLKSVHLEGRLEGLLLSMLVRQRYLNDSEETIEVSYTFPAGWGVNLMGFSVELNGKRMEAVALPKKKAEHRYEKAISSGDTPVMLEKSPLGLYTANLGNLKPGEEAEIIIEYAQLLRFENGRVRITVPTVIGQRYGDEVLQGHIAPHQTVQSDLLIEYPFTARLDVLGQMAKGSIDCPSHKVEMERFEGGIRLQLVEGGLLDRDFIVTIENLEGESYACASEDDGDYAVVASFCPKLEAKEPSPLGLKILVDCSGSMQGDSIEQAQEAMHELILRLSERDLVSYSKFGSNVVHTSNQLESCTPRYIKNVLARAVHETAADLGGTELNQALSSTFKISFTKAYTEGCDLLLITDGDVWEIEEIVKQAKISNHRIFAIGVGSAPAESLLRELAEQTGGACDLVTPSESIAEALLRMMQRIRASRTNSISIEWDGEVLWQSKLPKQIFSEETIHVHARLKDRPTKAPTLKWTVEGQIKNESAPSIEWSSARLLPRIVAGVEIASLNDQKVAEELALKYQLASNYTNLILVHIRDEEDKAQGLPTLQKVKQMQAAGWGGVGTAQRSGVIYACMSASVMDSAQPDYGSMAVPSVWRTNRAQASAQVDKLANGGLDDYEIPAFLRKQDEVAKKSLSGREGHSSPEDILKKFNHLTVTTNKFSEIVAALQSDVSSDDEMEVLRQLVDAGYDLEQIWACLIRWIANNVQCSTALTRHSLRILNEVLTRFSDGNSSVIESGFSNAFPQISSSAWGYVDDRKGGSILNRIKNLISGG